MESNVVRRELVDESVKKVLRDIRRGSIGGREQTAFVDGYMVFCHIIARLNCKELELLHDLLMEQGIVSYQAVDGNSQSSDVDIHLVVHRS